MSNFLDRFMPDNSKKKKSNSNWKGNTNNNSTNPITNFFNSIGGGNSTSAFSGTGQSLGGNTKPGIVIPITLSEVGPLGIQIEKSTTNNSNSNNNNNSNTTSCYAIVAMVVPDSQAERANIIRGDILCYANTDGREEIEYDIFLELAKSNQRPLCFDVRRIVTPSSTTTTKSKAATATTTVTSINTTTSDPTKKISAEAYARKQAMIAAAEKREKEHQKKYNTSSNSNKPIPLKPLLSTVEKNKLEQERQQQLINQSIITDANVEFVQRAKEIEQQTVSQLGYNPYISQSVTSGQARTAVTSTTHGTINTSSSSTTPPPPAANYNNQNSSSNFPNPGRISAPSSLPSADTNTTKTSQQQPSMEFQHAFETLVTSTPDTSIVINTINILRKLMINATTKGQDTTTSTAIVENEKYRKIRFMNNNKIRTTVTDIPGAIDILLSIGFQIHEEYNIELQDMESILLYPPNTIGPIWLSVALVQMEQYISHHQQVPAK